MDLMCKESIILGSDKITLDDPYRCFEKMTSSNINFIETANYDIVGCDCRVGIEILIKDRKYYIMAGMNRMGSNAAELAIGLLKRTRYLFLSEVYASHSIYTNNPEVVQRKIVDINDIYSTMENNVNEYIIYNYYLQGRLEEQYNNELKRMLKRHPNVIRHFEETLSTIPKIYKSKKK